MILLPFFIWPAVFGFTSFTNYAPAELRIHFVGFADYATVLGDPQFRIAFRNIVVFSLVSVTAELPLGFGLVVSLLPLVALATVAHRTLERFSLRSEQETVWSPRT